MTKQLTNAEKTFLSRMAPHVMAGKSFEEAGRAVLADDERLWLAATEKSDIGEAIRDGICEHVYANCRQSPTITQPGE